MPDKPTYEQLAEKVLELERQLQEKNDLTTDQIAQQKSGSAHASVQEQALKTSEKKYKTLFETMAQGAYFRNTEGKVVDCNSAALEMFGVSRLIVREAIRDLAANSFWQLPPQPLDGR